MHLVLIFYLKNLSSFFPSIKIYRCRVIPYKYSLIGVDDATLEMLIILRDLSQVKEIKISEITTITLNVLNSPARFDEVRQEKHLNDKSSPDKLLRN